jgi:hypothetical protein
LIIRQAISPRLAIRIRLNIRLENPANRPFAFAVLQRKSQ